MRRTRSRTVGILLIAAGLLLALVYTGFTLREFALLEAYFGESISGVGRRTMMPGLIGFNLVALVMVVVGVLLIRGGGRRIGEDSLLAVRPIRPAEHDALAALTARAYEQVMGDTLTPEYRAKLEDVDDRVARAQVLVAERDGRLLGGVTYVPGPGPWAEFADADAAGIRMLAVDLDAQGEGVGRRLVEECLALARAQGKARIVLHTGPEMLAARHLYGELGFERAPERDFTPVPGVDLMAFVHPLTR